MSGHFTHPEKNLLNVIADWQASLKIKKKSKWVYIPNNACQS